MKDPSLSVSRELHIGRLKRRADFVRAGKGSRRHGKAMTVQTLARGDDDPQVRVGFTLTRKVGCAVVRNRARRRLREAARLVAPVAATPGHDYVIVGRLLAIRLPFEDLTRELEQGMRARSARSMRHAGPERHRPSS